MPLYRSTPDRIAAEKLGGAKPRRSFMEKFRHKLEGAEQRATPTLPEGATGIRVPRAPGLEALAGLPPDTFAAPPPTLTGPTFEGAGGQRAQTPIRTAEQIRALNDYWRTKTLDQGVPHQTDNIFRYRDPFLAGVVQPAAGELGADVGGYTGEALGRTWLAQAMGAFLDNAFGVQPDGRGLGEAIGRFAGEAAVPTRGYELALEPAPGIGQSRGLLSAGRGLLRGTGRRIGEELAAEAALRAAGQPTRANRLMELLTAGEGGRLSDIDIQRYLDAPLDEALAREIVFDPELAVLGSARQREARAFLEDMYRAEGFGQHLDELSSNMEQGRYRGGRPFVPVDSSIGRHEEWVRGGPDMPLLRRMHVEAPDDETRAFIENQVRLRAADDDDAALVFLRDALGEEISPRTIEKAGERLKLQLDDIEEINDELFDAVLAGDWETANPLIDRLTKYVSLNNPAGNTARDALRSIAIEHPERGIQKRIPGEFGGVRGALGRGIGTHVAGGVAGAGAGATQGDTPQERFRNALLGAAAGVGGADVAVRSGLVDRLLSRSVGRSARSLADEAGVLTVTPEPPMGWPINNTFRAPLPPDEVIIDGQYSVANFNVAGYKVALIHDPEDGRGIYIGFEREGYYDARAKQIAGVEGATVPKGTMAEIREFGRFVYDTHRLNPDKRLFTVPANDRLERIYMKYGFDKVPGAYVELTFNVSKVKTRVAKGEAAALGGDVPQQGRMTDDGEIVFEDVLPGDTGAQGGLFDPATSGESLSMKGTMFEEPPPPATPREQLAEARKRLKMTAPGSNEESYWQRQVDKLTAEVDAAESPSSFSIGYGGTKVGGFELDAQTTPIAADARRWWDETRRMNNYDGEVSREIEADARELADVLKHPEVTREDLQTAINDRTERWRAEQASGQEPEPFVDQYADVPVKLPTGGVMSNAELSRLTMEADGDWLEQPQSLRALEQLAEAMGDGEELRTYHQKMLDVVAAAERGGLYRASKPPELLVKDAEREFVSRGERILDDAIRLRVESEFEVDDAAAKARQAAKKKAPSRAAVIRQIDELVASPAVHPVREEADPILAQFISDARQRKLLRAEAEGRISIERTGEGRGEVWKVRRRTYTPEEQAANRAKNEAAVLAEQRKGMGELAADETLPEDVRAKASSRLAKLDTDIADAERRLKRAKTQKAKGAINDELSKLSERRAFLKAREGYSELPGTDIEAGGPLYEGQAYIAGDRGMATGKTEEIGGETFHEYRMVEGAGKGSMKWSRQEPKKVAAPEAEKAPTGYGERKRAKAEKKLATEAPLLADDEAMRAELRTPEEYEAGKERMNAALQETLAQQAAKHERHLKAWMDAADAEQLAAYERFRPQWPKSGEFHDYAIRKVETDFPNMDARKAWAEARLADLGDRQDTVAKNMRQRIEKDLELGAPEAKAARPEQQIPENRTLPDERTDPRGYLIARYFSDHEVSDALAAGRTKEAIDKMAKTAAEGRRGHSTPNGMWVSTEPGGIVTVGKSYNAPDAFKMKIRDLAEATVWDADRADSERLVKYHEEELEFAREHRDWALENPETSRGPSEHDNWLIYHHKKRLRELGEEVADEPGELEYEQLQAERRATREKNIAEGVGADRALERAAPEAPKAEPPAEKPKAAPSVAAERRSVKEEMAALDREITKLQQGIGQQPSKAAEKRLETDLRLAKLRKSELARKLEEGKPPPPRPRVEPEVNAGKFDASERFARVNTDQIRVDAETFQARLTEEGKTYGESRVNDIVKNYDPDLMTPLIVVPDPKKKGGFVLLAGHHRLEALKRLGLKADVQIVELDITDAAQLKRARAIADASNATQHTLSLKERIRVIDRAGTEEIGQLRSQFPAFNDQQIRDAIYISQLPGHVVDKLDKMPETAPHVGIAAEVGYGRKAYGLTEDEAEGLFNRLTAGTKNKLPTRPSVRETMDKFGQIIQQRSQLGMFGEETSFAASNRIIDAMDEYARTTREIGAEKRELARAVKLAVNKLKIGADTPEIKAAEARVAELEGKLRQLETDFLGGLREPDAQLLPSSVASSTAEAKGSERILSGSPPETATQAPSEILSTTSEEPSGLTTRQMEPSEALRGETTSEYVTDESVAPERPTDEEGWRNLELQEERAFYEGELGTPHPDVDETYRLLAESVAPPKEPPSGGYRGRTTPPEPPKPPELPPAAEKKPDGTRYVAPLRPFDRVVAEVKTTKNRVKRALIGKTHINPSILDDSVVGKALTAYARQEIAAEELAATAVTAALDPHVQRYTGRTGHVFSIGSDGLVKNLTLKDGQSGIWQDVFSRPGDYDLTDAQRAYIADFRRVVDEGEAMRVEAGLKARAKQGPEGWFYVPRQVKGIRGVEIKRPSSPSMQRLYELAQEGAAKGIQYDTNPRATLELHLRAAYEEVLQKQLADALEPVSIVPKDLVSAGLRAEAEKVGDRMKTAYDAILALQRAKRGEQIPTGTVKAIEAMFPELDNRVAEATDITLDDLLSMTERAEERGRVTFKPVSAGTLKQQKKTIAEMEEFARQNPKKGMAALKKARREHGFAKWRFSQEQEIRDAQNWTYSDHVEMGPSTWLEIERSTRTLVRENVRKVKAGEYGPASVPMDARVDVVEMTQREMLDELIKEIRGTPFEAKTATGQPKTVYRGGLMDGIRDQVADVRQRYTGEMARARRSEITRSDLTRYRRSDQSGTRAAKFSKMDKTQPFWGPDQPEEIAIGQWRGRFFKREDAELLAKHLGAFGRTKEEAHWLSKGFEQLGNHVRFLSSVGDFAAPFIQGLPLLVRHPAIWGSAALRHYQAFLDPTVQPRLVREYLAEFQEMAQHGTPIGDPEFFAALREGFSIKESDTFGKLLEMAPGVDEARLVAGNVGKQTFGRFQSSYNTMLAVSRAQLTRSLRNTITDAAERQQLIRNLTGGLNSRALGVGPAQRGFEATWLAFSPRLFRSTVALVRDAARGPQDAVGREALMSLGSLAAGVTGIYVATGLALGKSNEEIKTGLNPLSGKKFLSHQVNGDWIGVGGQLRALMQLSATAIAHPKDLTVLDQDNPLYQWYAGRGAPGLNIGGSIIEGLSRGKFNAAPYAEVDGPLDIFPHIATSALPFALQGVLEGQKPLTTAAGLVGGRTSPATFKEQGARAVKGGDFEGSYSRAVLGDDTGMADRIKAAWRASLEPKLKSEGAYVVRGAFDEETGLGRAPVVEFKRWDAIEARVAQAMSGKYGVPAGDYKSIKDVRKAFVDKFAPALVKKGLGSAAARSKVESYFNQLAPVRRAQKAEQRFRLTFWAKHPKLFDEVQRVGWEADLSADELKIVGAARGRER